MAEPSEPKFTVEETLEALQGILDPVALQLATDALRRGVNERQGREASEHRLILITGLMQDYDKLCPEDYDGGYTDTPDNLAMSSYGYLRQVQDTRATDELDSDVRMYAAYAWAAYGDVADDKAAEAVEFIRTAGVNPTDVENLIYQSLHDRNLSLPEWLDENEKLIEHPTLEDIIDGSLLLDRSEPDYFSYPEHVQRIKQELDKRNIDWHYPEEDED
jgi:hypothetical protein